MFDGIPNGGGKPVVLPTRLCTNRAIASASGLPRHPASSVAHTMLSIVSPFLRVYNRRYIQENDIGGSWAHEILMGKTTCNSVSAAARQCNAAPGP